MKSYHRLSQVTKIDKSRAKSGKVINKNFIRTLCFNKWLIILLFLIANGGCKKLVVVEGPYTSINESNLFSNDATAISLMTSVYAKMSANSIFSGGLTSISFFSGLSSDEFSIYTGINDINLLGYYKNSLSSSNSNSSDLWLNVYPIIYITNTVIDGLSQSNSLTPSISQQLLGEAKFIRALCYFYLVNFYGDTPLALSTDYTVNASLARAPKDIVYGQIIEDLKSAKKLLSSNYIDKNLIVIGNERIRPIKWVASALLARVYLFMHDYINAETESTSIIQNTSLYNIDSDLNETFLKNSNEAIWQLQPVNYGWNTEDGRVFIIPNTGVSDAYPVYLSQFILNSFEANDYRRRYWVDSVNVDGIIYFYPYKYKSSTLGADITEYSMVFRLAEQYLIRSEARTMQGNMTGTTGGISDLDVIRHRAGLAGYSGGADKPSVLAAILHERQVELFSEWGHRWLDLKRSGNIDAVMSVVTPLKGGTWNTNWQLYPIPLGELQKTPKIKQNPGYE
ncbi:RagB/SusD family nutrient uptake outer membrane protein [Chitinophaga oryziterrae]|uniref:RagB/SusD family nutrient uptake outer membrane protein n=1 Tax=Chitinophaga oryziterrae TaxID=1031224 RepID=A0A6N8JC68_9BACT|nr:RagB/SusD family nutrient uptake outer membrane protein [Chitinophaga oryziterrae]MVT41849.1 RagB/SusD family nutrient uptake outer membrane protein [Chitinophaga oryziterrae]